MDNSAMWMAAAGGLAVLIAAIAWWRDRARMARSQLDQVGFMPWTGVFFWSTMLALLLLGGAAKAWL
ncbi:cell division protein FtsX [Novosphingobium chloroacetimidivorans]|uniref:Cell division protein FtsX n=1 Tax=Novosphingobium chloroacetimidivorans TaxID=1428314 RepID=A0A7W7NX60_9SPHN|nr:hypothetical protein [Novosphingobium chloroacetimidivorans]MBB4859084.1 cell division protein FtsX [Novosphingobium chloroacetimidivorans]